MSGIFPRDPRNLDGPRDLVQLDYVATTDVANGVAVPAGGWVDLGPVLSFRVQTARAIVEVALGGHAIITAPAANEFGSRLLVDGARARFVGGTSVPAGGQNNVLAGAKPWALTDLGVGTHTVLVQVSGYLAGGLLYCRPATVGHLEGLTIDVIERASAAAGT